MSIDCPAAPSPPAALGCAGRRALALVVACLHLRHSTAFQRPAAVGAPLLLGGARSRPSSPQSGLCAARISEDGECHGRVDDVERLSRRDVLARTLSGAGLALAASVSGSGVNAMELPNFLLAADGSGDRGVKGMPNPTKKVGGLSGKIRSVSKIMDELQRDLMQERWDLVEGYPNQLRSFVPVFTAYTDTAFPTDIPTDKGLRVALRYEVGRFFASLERFRQATSRKSLDEAYIAYSDMSLHFDRYLRVGGLYTFYDDNVSLEPYYQGVSDASLVYADPKKDPALVRDLVVLVKGPEKGRTGIVIGIYPDGSNTCAVKLDRRRGIREIRVVPQEWAAKRLGEQDPDDVFLIPQAS